MLHIIYWVMCYKVGAYLFIDFFSLLIHNPVRANFEFLEKIGVDRWCFHDRDIAPDGETLEVSEFLNNSISWKEVGSLFLLMSVWLLNFNYG